MARDQSLQSFIHYLQYEKRFSKHTITAYEGDLKQFFTFLEEQYDLKAIENIPHGVIRSWIVNLMELKITPRSVNRKISTLKTFYKYLLRQGLLKENPMLKIQAPKTSKRLPVFVEEDKMEHLLNNIPFKDDFEGKRDKLMLEMFYASGMRLSELIQLKLTDINLSSGTLKVLGKRNKERIIPIAQALRHQIEGYLSDRNQVTQKEERFFCSESGKGMYEKQVYRLVNKYLTLVSTIDKKSPHVLRHTFATHMLNNGADLNAIKEILGHASLSATQVYTHNTIEKIKHIYKQAHPKA